MTHSLLLFDLRGDEEEEEEEEEEALFRIMLVVVYKNEWKREEWYLLTTIFKSFVSFASRPKQTHGLKFKCETGKRDK